MPARHSPPQPGRGKLRRVVAGIALTWAIGSRGQGRDSTVMAGDLRWRSRRPSRRLAAPALAPQASPRTTPRSTKLQSAQGAEFERLYLPRKRGRRTGCARSERSRVAEEDCGEKLFDFSRATIPRRYCGGEADAHAAHSTRHDRDGRAGTAPPPGRSRPLGALSPAFPAKRKRTSARCAQSRGAPILLQRSTLLAAAHLCDASHFLYGFVSLSFGK